MRIRLTAATRYQLFCLLGALGVWICGRIGAAEGVDAMPGRLLAMSYCQTCHAVPDPVLLDRATWKNELLPKMKIMTGVVPPPTNGVFKDLDFLLASHYFPEKALVPAEAFDVISDYYIAAAPEKTGSNLKHQAISMNCRQFVAVVPSHRRSPPNTTLVKIDSREHLVVMGDANLQGVDMLNPAGDLVQSFNVGNIPTAMQETDRGLYFACIGHFFPRDQQRGQVVFLEKSDAGLVRHEIGGLLPRLSDLQVADLNGDGREDFVLCAFGNLIGRLSWFEGKGGGKFEEHVLLDKPGALRCEIRDLNGDGHPDIAVLVAQALETFFVFTGDGKGGFEKQVIYQKPPSWGHSGFQLADFNGDGRLDLLVTNGDNADFRTSPMHAHHGIRILLNEGGFKFREAWFFPMNGAYRAIARDFDRDGDLDIAAISFFPDFENSPGEGFVYLENLGGKEGFKFVASGIKESLRGRWLTLDAGDLDGDGDEDLVLGSLIQMPTLVPGAIKKEWEEDGPSVLILKNTLK